jgi:phosphoglycolate phosphatase
VTPIIPNSFGGVIFDLDGTLMDTADEIAAALARTFADADLPALPKKAVEALIGRGIASLVERALVQAGAPVLDLGEVVARFEGHYARTVGTASQLFPGVLPGLQALARAEMPMAVVTNKARYFTEKLLVRAGIAGFFAAVVAGDDGIRRKPHGDMLLAACERMGTSPAATLMLGDSDNDIHAAREAGCAVWCVPYGYNEGRPPESLACDRLVETVVEAVDLLLATPAR